MFHAKTALILLLCTVFCATSYASTPEYFNSVVNAIYKVENSKAYPYGIKSIPTYGNENLARKYCYNTVRNNWKRWERAGRPGNYLDFLADRYCPKSADPIGNKNWKKNIRFFLGVK